MQRGRGIKRIPLSRATNLPWLKPPAGYVLVIEDVEYRNRFIIVRLQELSPKALARATVFPFETELFLVFSAPNAAELALALHHRFAASGDLNEWFDLNQAQVAQLRDFGRASLRDLALNEAAGESLVQDARIISARPERQRAPTQAAQRRPRRRWPAWLLLLAIVALGVSVIGNAPQLRRLLSGRTSITEMLAGRNAVASATAYPTRSPTRRAATPTQSPVAGAGDVFYLRTRANARICARITCRAAAVVDAGTRIVALGFFNGQSVDGDRIWIKFRHERQSLFIHRSVLSQNRPAVNAARRSSATATLTAVPSATATPTRTPAPTDTATLTHTVEPTHTDEQEATSAATITLAPGATATVAPTATDAPVASATPTDTRLPPPTATSLPSATATDAPAALYIDTVNDRNANVRACPRTDCDILGQLPPGAAISPTGSADGEVVYGTALWITFDYEGQPAFVHSELVAAAE